MEEEIIAQKYTANCVIISQVYHKKKISEKILLLIYFTEPQIHFWVVS